MSSDDRHSFVLRFLQKESIFGSVRPSALRKLATLARVLEVPKGKSLYTMGQPCQELNFLVSGQAQVKLLSKDGRERLLHLVLPGDMVGAVPFFDGKDYPCTVVTDTDSRFVVFHRDDLMKLLVGEGEVTLAILGGLMARLRKMVGLLEEMTFTDTTQRLWKYLVENSSSADGKLPRLIDPLPTREKIANSIGTVREVVSRRLSHLIESGHISIEGRKLLIHKNLL